ncbi:MAG: UvrD-helicase domain-containing protein [Synergistaceae bacterium]|nr:UvrD-helicase domain-containing protein [Synergistaceae bacterium]
MTEEEQRQVQNIINARTKLLTERVAQQDEYINSLNERLATTTAELEAKKQEVSSLKSQVSEYQEQNKKLLSLVQENKPMPQTQPTIQPQEKPNYLVSLLRQHFNFDTFKPGQEEIINALLSGRDVFCSMPDGYGKSICFRLPALLMPGLTLAVVPEVPKDFKTDLHSEALTPNLSATKKREILRKVKNGSCKILYSALSELAQDDIASSLSKVEISAAALISFWGVHDELADWKDFLVNFTKAKFTTGLFTNSTSPALRNDLMKLADLRSPLKIVAGFERRNFTFKITRTEHKLEALRDILTQKKDLPGVVYCSTPEDTYKLRENFRDHEKVIILPSVLYREALSHDARFVVHYDLPENLGDYSQQITCAGISKADCFLLVSRNALRNVDKSVIKFCDDKEPEKILLSYLGEDGKFTAQSIEQEQSEREKISPEDFSDFDFGRANEAQKEAITSTNGPVLIIAGPGTGKTFTLVQRAVFLIQKRKVKPENILLAAFTDKAARELTTRITEELSNRSIHADTNSMFVGTFHVICERIINDYISFTHFKRGFRIMDDFEHAHLILRSLNKFLELDGADDVFRTLGRWTRAKELRDYMNILYEELIDPEELLRDTDKSVNFLGHAMKIHAEILAENNSLSWSALLVETYRLLRDNPEILDDIHEQIKYVMIDEYQDTNYIQEQLAFLLAGESKNICVVGDDDQSLYRFRGAEVRNILEFPDKFGKNECKIVKLMLNYRSERGIINFFSEWMNDTRFFTWGKFRHDKALEAYRNNERKYPAVMRLAGIDDKDEWHEKVLHFINSLKNSGKITDYSQIAFLFRSVKAQDAQELAQFLENNNINIYSPRSDMYFKRAEVQFAIGCLISIFPEYLKSLGSGAFNFRGVQPGFIAYYKNCLKTVARYIDKPAYSGLKKFLLDKRKFHQDLTGNADYVYSDLLYELFAFMPFNHALNVNANDTVKNMRPARNLSKFMQIIKSYESSYNINNISAKSMNSQFVNMMNIFLRFQYEDGLDEYESDKENIPAGHIAFMTIHQAKGMEFPIVFVDSMFSSPMPKTHKDRNDKLINSITRKYSRRPEFEPEDQIKYFDFWRLFYVAFSRAQDLLILTCSENNNTPSKYLEASYNKLDDADEVFSLENAEISGIKGAGLKETFSFTTDILMYETCPMQYKFYSELEFPQKITQAEFVGSLIHLTLEEIHRAVLEQEGNKLTEQNILEWFNTNYENLSRSQQKYLSQAAREAILTQVMNYVKRQGSDWSALRRAEYEISLVREDYILKGKTDLISVRDGETEITDFKSGSKPNINITRDRDRLETYRRQLNIYAYLVEKSSGLNVNRMRLYYTGEAGNPEIVYDYDKSEAEKIIAGLDETVRKIMSKDFEHRTTDMDICKMCDFRFYCGRE